MRASRGGKIKPGGGGGGARARPGARMWRAALAVGLGVALEALLAWLLRRRAAAVVREVLFFPSRVTCTEELLAGAPCACPLPHGDSALGRLLARVLAARRSLELCVFAFSSPQLGRAVVLLHRRGVRVRVVVDADYMAVRGSQIGLLRRAGIPVRHDQERGYMHHKFAIVDRRVLITGSLNWTSQAIQNNRENVLVLGERGCVGAFLAEFERIWAQYDPANYTFFSET